MTLATADFMPGNLVRARGREWVVQSDNRQDDGTQLLRLRPLGGADDDIVTLIPALEFSPVEPATFEEPDPEQPGNHAAALLLRDALRLKLRAGGGPFRSFGNIAVEPRAYQLVPLLMALRLSTVRLLIADDVGVGKTIEAGLIVRELMDRGEIGRLPAIPLHVEHVMPVAWAEHWPSPGDDNAVLLRNSLLHNIGNLTLLTAKLNPSLSNSNFSVKKARDHQEPARVECPLPGASLLGAGCSVG
ncbi:MAG: DUF1524 domain-containing protein [Burkholderiales bacterium]|nr:DUF1524 domain-containing protein [Burkholderiales bacterium]